MQNETKFTGWVGAAASILGSFLMAFQFALIGYSCFLVGSVAWLYIGAVRNEKPLIVLNGAFLVANIIGFYNVL